MTDGCRGNKGGGEREEEREMQERGLKERHMDRDGKQ